MASDYVGRMWLLTLLAKPQTTIVTITCFLLLFLIQGIFFIRANSPTYDEAMHVAAGYSYFATGDFRIERENPPLVKEILALPLFLIYRLPFNPQPQHWRDAADFLVGQDFLYGSSLPADHMLALSRLSNLFLGSLLVALTAWWSYRLWGGRAVPLAMALASLEPNLVAHSSLVTTDMGFTLFMFLTVYLLWEYLNFPSWWLLAATGFSTGMALISKYSAILLIPIIAIIIAASLLIDSERHLLPLRKNQHQPIHKLLHAAAVFCLILFFASLMIPPGYFFQGFQPWFFGLWEFLAVAQGGQAAFFLGQYSYQGWWNYFAVAFLIKTSIGALILIAASLALYHAGTPIAQRAAVFLLLPVIVIFLAMSQAKVNIGVRHILSVYPFLFVLASRLATVHFRRHWFTPLLIGTPLVLTAISSLRIAPHQLAYFNEFVGGPDQGYRYLSDSNVDWGQDLKGVKTYMEKENLPMIYLSYFGTAPPSYYGIRYQYVPGAWPLEWPLPSDKVPTEAQRKILAISVSNLQDVSNPYNPLFRWLWMRRPVARIGYSIFVYDLTDDRDGLEELEETYLKSGIGPALVISR